MRTGPRLQAFNADRSRNENRDVEQHADAGSRVDVLGLGLDGIYRRDEESGQDGNQNQGDEAAQMAALLASANTGQIKSWSTNISQDVERRRVGAFPNDSALKYIGQFASPVTFEVNSLADANREDFGGYKPWRAHQGGDMTPLAGSPILVEGEPFNLKTGLLANFDDPNAMPMEWAEQIDGAYRKASLQHKPFNEQLVALGRYNV